MQTSANRGGEGGTWQARVHGGAKSIADHLRHHHLGLRHTSGSGGSKLAGAPRLRSDEDPLESRSDPAHGCVPAPAPVLRTEALKAAESLEEYQISWGLYHLMYLLGVVWLMQIGLLGLT